LTGSGALDFPKSEELLYSMNENFEFAVRAVSIGIGATLLMEAWAFALRQFGIPSLNFAFLGRWLGHLPEGKWFHESIGKAAPIRHELLLGWLAHYSIGISFNGLLLAMFGRESARSPSVLPPLAIGMLTVVAPLFILQPALGAGIASSKTPTPIFNSFKSVVTHTVYGFGLYLSALAMDRFYTKG
jgi:Protein of unknown function (DUF2938)